MNKKNDNKTKNSDKSLDKDSSSKDDAVLDNKNKELHKELRSKIKDFSQIIDEYDVPLEHISSRVILEKMIESLEHYIKIVIQIMQPEDYSSLHECTIFDDDEKSKMFITYKDMMILHREILKSLIRNDEKDILTTIAYAHSELKNLKPEILRIVQKMQDSWKETGTKGRMRYFG